MIETNEFGRGRRVEDKVILLEPSVWIWVPLSLAVVAAFFERHKTTAGLLSAALCAALLEGRLSLTALTILLIGFGVAYGTPRGSSRCVGYVLVFVWSIALFNHLIPGFNNIKVLDNVTAGPQSAPFTMHLNLDKPMLFFALLLAYPTLLGKAKTPNYCALAATLIPLFALLPVAKALGALELELHAPAWWWLFALNNLLLTCPAEEALFRGFLQQAITQRLGWISGVVGASIVFGIQHFAGGPLLIVFATLAGIGYGLIYHLTGRLWAAVLVHFLFNFAHLLFFTYPIPAH